MTRPPKVHPADVIQSILLSSVQVDAVAHLSEIFFSQDMSLYSGDPADTRFHYQKRVHLPLTIRFNSKSYRFDYVRNASLKWSLEDVFSQDVEELVKLFGVYGLRQLRKELTSLGERSIKSGNDFYTSVDSVKNELLTANRSLLVRAYSPSNQLLQLHALEGGSYVAVLAQKIGGEFQVNAVRRLIYRDEIRDILSLVKGYKQMGNEDISREFVFMFEILSAPELDQDLFLEDVDERELDLAQSSAAQINNSPSVV